MRDEDGEGGVGRRARRPAVVVVVVERLRRVIVAAVVAALGVGLAVAKLDPTSRVGSFVAVAAGGAAIVLFAVGLGWLAGGPGPKALVSTLGAHPGRRIATGGLSSDALQERADAEQLVEEIEREAGQ